jgi:hypothetical protein
LSVPYLSPTTAGKNGKARIFTGRLLRFVRVERVSSVAELEAGKAFVMKELNLVRGIVDYSEARPKRPFWDSPGPVPVRLRADLS